MAPVLVVIVDVTLIKPVLEVAPNPPLAKTLPVCRSLLDITTMSLLLPLVKVVVVTFPALEVTFIAPPETTAAVVTFPVPVTCRVAFPPVNAPVVTVPAVVATFKLLLELIVVVVMLALVLTATELPVRAFILTVDVPVTANVPPAVIAPVVVIVEPLIVMVPVKFAPVEGMVQAVPAVPIMALPVWAPEGTFAQLPV